MLRELEAEPTSVRHKIIDFFSRILVEYEDYANSLEDTVGFANIVSLIGREGGMEEAKRENCKILARTIILHEEKPQIGSRYCHSQAAIDSAKSLGGKCTFR